MILQGQLLFPSQEAVDSLDNPGLAGGDGLAVAPSVGTFGQVGAELFDFADVGFAFVGVGGTANMAMLANGDIQDERYRAGVGVAAG